MPNAILAPLFLAGLGLIVIPFLIHQIRRPEREPLRFSSLMFIPKIDKKVIERRRVQHILLMLLRMLLFTILAAAFARPYLKSAASAALGGDLPANHVILVDNSYSMGTQGWFDDAKSEAEKIVNGIGPADNVAVVAFSDSPRILVPLEDEDDPEAGGSARALREIQSLKLSQRGTAYVPALQAAQEMLLTGEPAIEETPTRLIMHLISDFQVEGMPEENAGWRLSPRIGFKPIEVGDAKAKNHAVADLGLKSMPSGELRVLAKIKNWTRDEEKPVEASLFVNGKEVERKPVVVNPLNASQVAFQVPADGSPRFEGYVRLESDTLEIDNVRYFAWQPPRKKNILLIADTIESQWPAKWFIQKAIELGERAPWTLTGTTQEKLEETLGAMGLVPDLILLGEARGVSAATAEQLLKHAREGGEIFISLNSTMAPEDINAMLLEPLGLKSAGLRHENASELRYDLLSSVNFSHPIFFQFQGARFNDFSQLRFFNFHILERTKDDPSISTIARFEDNEGNLYPAMIDVKLGRGRAMVWPFSIDLQMSNLPKNIKFVPLFHETLNYLTDVDQNERMWRVGEQYSELQKLTNEGSGWIVRLPNRPERTIAASDEPESLRLEEAGYIRTRMADTTEWEHVEPVNIRTEESNPDRISTREFALKLTSSPDVQKEIVQSQVQEKNVPADFIIAREYGHLLVGVLLFMLLFESWYASRIVR